MSVNTYSLVSLDNIKKFMGMTGSTSDGDDLLEDLINRVSTLFESYMNEHILSRSYTEYHDGKGVYVLFPKHSPITSITSIHDDYDWDYLDADLIDSDDYTIVNDNYIALKTAVSSFADYTQNVKIIYTAGYLTVPDDLIQACITEVSRAYNNRLEVDVTSRTLSDGSVSYSAKTFLPLTITTLNRYRGLNII